jgi:hypothetical protein
MAYDDGQLYAVTLGEFISLLVDAGHDPCVLFRVVADTPVDGDGKFLRKIEMTLVPDGYVGDSIREAHRVHKTLRALIDGGVIS